MVDIYKVCKEVNTYYGGKIFPHKYCGNFPAGIWFWLEYGPSCIKKCTPGEIIWDIGEGVFSVKFIGDLEGYWPIHRVNCAGRHVALSKNDPDLLVEIGDKYG